MRAILILFLFCVFASASSGQGGRQQRDLSDPAYRKLVIDFAKSKRHDMPASVVEGWLKDSLLSERPVPPRRRRPAPIKRARRRRPATTRSPRRRRPAHPRIKKLSRKN